MMILLTFDLCSSVFQVFVAVLVSLREGSFIFFCAVSAGVPCSLCDFRLHLCVSFVGLYALWLVFSTVSAYIFKAAFRCAG